MKEALGPCPTMNKDAPAFPRANRLHEHWKCLGERQAQIAWMVEVAGIEPASADPTLTGYYMFSLRFDFDRSARR